MWSAEDRLYALAWDAIEKGKCPCGCGHPMSETTDPANEDRFTGHAVRCFAGQAKSAAFERVDDKAGLLAYVSRDEEDP